MTYNLNQLQAAAQRLLALLDNRHPGLVLWNEALDEAIQGVHTASMPECDAATPQAGPAWVETLRLIRRGEIGCLQEEGPAARLAGVPLWAFQISSGEGATPWEQRLQRVVLSEAGNAVLDAYSTRSLTRTIP